MVRPQILLGPKLVAKFCGISTHTVQRCRRSKKLKGWRIPGSTQFRYRKQDVIAFMREHDIPIPDELRKLSS